MSKTILRKKNLKEIILQHNILSEEEYKNLHIEAKRTNTNILQLLVNLQKIEKGKLLYIISKEWDTPAIDLTEITIDPDIAKIITEQSCRNHLAIPFAKADEILFVAMADPLDFFVTEDIQLRTGFTVQPYLALPEDINASLNKIYGESIGAKAEELVKSVTESDAEATLEKIEQKVDIAEIDANAPEVEKLVNAIILGGLSWGSSDIHIEPFEDKILTRYRVDGELREAPFVTPFSYRNALIAKLKIMTNQMDITERRKPQDGRIQILFKGKPVEFRVNIIPTVFGESCVMRVLDRSSARRELHQLGFLPDTLEKYKSIYEKPYGLILVCGPTGSGKSATLYATLNALNSPDVKILTVEDPVEYNLPGIIQINVNRDVGLDFATALRAFLRQDPDIILVGEIRDKETAQTAMEAAMTGHMVFSTIHTNDAPSAVARLHEMGIPSFMVASTVEGVLAQRLVRRICSDCKVETPLTDEYKLIFKNYKIDCKDKKIYKGKGCNTCMNTGYKGRLAIHEFLVMSDELRKLCLKEVARGAIAELSIKEGMRTLVQDGLLKVFQGLTTVEEILASAQ